MTSKLCRARQSASNRRESSARHIAVSYTSGEIVATSAVFIRQKQKQFGLMGMAPSGARKDAWAEEKINSPMGPMEVALALTSGVVFSVYQPGGIAILPSVDVLRGRAFRLAPKSGLEVEKVRFP